jgi:hypothetical protein
MQKTYERATRLIRAATGEEWGDGLVVDGIGIGIAEPGYGDDATVWAMGNWNPRRFRRDGEPPLSPVESLPERLADALTRQGVELLWLDEWIECDECQRAFRCEPDSYSWQMFGVITEDGTTLCADHVDWETVEDEAINNPRYAIRDTLPIDLESEGFTRHNGTFENGWWHPGQDDDPVAILNELRKEWGEVVFRVSGVGQFDIAFEVWTRSPA